MSEASNSSLTEEGRSSSVETVTDSSSDAAEVEQNASMSLEQLLEERNRYKRELQDLSERMHLSAGILQHRLLQNFTLLEKKIRRERRRKKLSDKQCQTDRPWFGHRWNSGDPRSGSSAYDISYPNCFLAGRGATTHCWPVQCHLAPFLHLPKASEAARRLGPTCEALDLAMLRRSGSEAGVTTVADGKPRPSAGAMQPPPPQQQQLVLEAPDSGYAALTASNSASPSYNSPATGPSLHRSEKRDSKQLLTRNAVAEVVDEDSQQQLSVLAPGTTKSELTLEYATSALSQQDYLQSSRSVSKAFAALCEPSASPEPTAHSSRANKDFAAASQETTVATVSQETLADTSLDNKDSVTTSQETTKDISLSNKDSPAASQETTEDTSRANKDTTGNSNETTTNSSFNSKDFAASSQDPSNQASNKQSAPENCTTDCSAEAGTLVRLKQLAAPIRLDIPSSLVELTGLGPFPSLPNSRLQLLGLLPATLAELAAANAAVSIVDPNSRYKLEGPPGVGGSSSSSSQAVEQQSADERLRELVISFSNDAATVAERVKRVSLARANLEENLAGELSQLEAALAAGGPGTAGALASVQLLRSTAGRLSRTAEVLGAVEQECRLNYVFHFIHKYSEELRSDKEKMSGELEMLRQAVEDEAFYADADGALSKYSKSHGASNSSVKARAKFQQIGRSVARTTSVTSLLQRLARERDRRRQRLTTGTDDGTKAAEDGSKEALDDTEDPAEGDDEVVPSSQLGIDGGDLADQEEIENTVLDRLDKLSAGLFADRRIRLFVAPLTMLVSLIFLLWAIVYPILKRII